MIKDIELQGDLGVTEWTNMRPLIRPDISFTFHKIKGKSCYVISDPVHSRYYRIGVAEYKFISLLNGKRNLSETMQAMAESMGQEALTNEEVIQILNWLARTGLLVTDKAAPADTMPAVDSLLGVTGKLGYLIFPKIPFGNPDRLLSFLLPLFRPILGLAFAFVWLGTILTGLYVIFSQWPRFVSASNNILAPDNWIAMGLVWIVLKVVHEIWHGLICKYHGGTVRETGVLLIVLMPICYVDTSSCWNISSKWRRIHVSIAGMYIELFIAAIAAIVWSESAPGVLNNLCHNIIVMASITTLIFNGNPLMRFDGYYVLIDLLEEPNLYTRAKNYLVYLSKRYILGVNLRPPQQGWSETIILFTYGVAAALWRILIYVSISIGTSLLFLGAGVVLTFICIVIWIVIPTAQILRYMVVGKSMEKPKRLRSLAVCLLFISAIYFSFTKITWRKSLQAPGIVVYSDVKTLRVYGAGFVKKVHVKTMDRVKTGDLLATLENRKIEAELVRLSLDIELSKAKIRKARQQSIALMQLESERLQFLKKRWLEQKALKDSLVIKAPMDGFIATRNVLLLQKQYLVTGSELLTIHNEEQMKLEIAIDQEDVEHYQKKIGDTLEVYIPSIDKELKGKLIKISPKASRKVPHLALSVLGGGPLTIQHNPQGQKFSGESFQLLTPHFLGELILPEEHYALIRSGQRGHVYINREPEKLGLLFYYSIKSWLQEQYEISKKGL